MAIQWYPGHMHKARKEMIKVLPQVDLLIEVLDARIPYSSENPAIGELRGDTPSIKVLNKSDLADEAATQIWVEHFNQQSGIQAMPLTQSQPGKVKQLLDLCREMLPEKNAGVKTIHTMIVGIPNVGKSTLINTLAGKTIAKTGNEPAVTKSQQRINLGNGILLLDTPGILWPKVENLHSGYRLAATGAIKNTAMEYDDVGYYLAEHLLANYPESLKQRFQLDTLGDTADDFLHQAAERRGALARGGRANLHKICEVLINEFRSGMLGPLTLETPKMVEQEEIQVAEIKQQKEEQKRQRKQAAKQRRNQENPS